MFADVDKLCLVTFVIVAGVLCARDARPSRISVTISSKLRRVEVSWFNTNIVDGIILITDREPNTDFRQILQPYTDDRFYAIKNKSFIDTSTVGSQVIQTLHRVDEINPNLVWVNGADNRTVLYWLHPTASSGWHTTTISFDINLSKNITINTRCYGYWATYLDSNGVRLASACLSAYPTWMNDMRNHIGSFKFKDLFIAGTHDSGSYRENFDPTKNETLVTKYSLTQDDDIRGQLMHGVRYLDIRVGYYRTTNPPFWVNHGISRQQPLLKVLQQVRDFVMETDEIVIFDVQEFPVGFGKKLDVHKNLIQFIKNEIGELIVDPALTWEATLSDIWKTKRNIIVSYDHLAIVQEFPLMLWMSVQQRWGNVQSLTDLKRYLSPAARNFVLFSSRPIADMAELTPNTWDVITDRYGGLRRMADQTNRQISKWYIEEWGPTTNIVAVDFVRGTNLIETSLYWNAKKDILQ